MRRTTLTLTIALIVNVVTFAPNGRLADAVANVGGLDLSEPDANTRYVPWFTGRDMAALIGRKHAERYNAVVADVETVVAFIDSRINEQSEDFDPKSLTHALVRAANRHRLDPLLLLAIIEQESAMNPRARGRHGEIGLMQIKPSTARWLANHRGANPPTREDLFRPLVNVEYGAAYLAWLEGRFPAQPFRVLNAYNGGPAAARATRGRYSIEIVKRYHQFLEDIRQTGPTKEL